MNAKSSVASSGIVHELLTKYNYQRWRPVMQKYLQGQGLWEVVEGDTGLKATHDIEQGPWSVSVDETEASWKMKDAKALHIILLSCGPEILDEISHSKTAKSAWDYLREQYGELKAKQYNEQAIMGDQTDGRLPRKYWLFPRRERRVCKSLLAISKSDELSTTESGNRTINPELELFSWAEEGYNVGPFIGDSNLRKTSASGRTLLHAAVIGGNLLNVKILVKKGKDELIHKKDNRGYTALALAARYTGNTDIARCLIESGNSTREGLLAMEDKDGEIPVLLAAAGLHKEMTSYLYSKTPHKEVFDKADSRNRVLLLARCITAQIFGVALKLLRRYPDLLRESFILSRFSSEDIVNNSLEKFNENQFGVEGDFSILVALAKMPSAFSSGSQFGLQKQFIYDILNVEREFLDNCEILDIVNTEREFRNRFLNHMIELVEDFVDSVTEMIWDVRGCWSVRGISIQVLNFLFLPAKLLGLILRGIAYLLIPIFKRLNIFGTRELYDQKYTHYEVLAVLNCFARSVEEYNDLQLKEALAYKAMLQAAQNGIVEFIFVMTYFNPKLLLAVDSWDRDMVTYAVLNRKQNMFQDLIRRELNSHGLQKNIHRYRTDAFDNNLLHMAAHLGPTSSTSGAALQMQREIQWFKAVEEVVHPLCKEAKNADGKKPHELFTESHGQLMKAGEKWAKDMAGSFSLVGTLITTMMFAAAFTVPGGNNQETGLPIFLHDKIFTAFLIADVVSLFTSATSVIIFIWIQTSRFAEKDFLSSLPWKLLSGLLLLIISVCSMVVAFCAAHAIIIKGYRSYNWFVVGPILSLASIPITVLVISQLRLMYDILRSTWKNPISSINIRG